MKKQTKTRYQSGYASLIQKATGASDEALPVIERIMRDEIFHSTLDWQSAAEFQNGARKAMRLYVADRAFYDAEQNVFSSRWQAHLAEIEYQSACSQGPSARIAKAEGNLLLARKVEQEAAKRFDSYISPISRQTI